MECLIVRRWWACAQHPPDKAVIEEIFDSFKFIQFPWSMNDPLEGRVKIWENVEKLRNHNLQRNPTRLTYTIYFIQFLGHSPPGIIATSVKSERLQNEDKDLTGTDWVMFRFARRSYENYEKKGIKAASLWHRAWVFPFLCLLHPLQCLMLHLPLKHSWMPRGIKWLECCVLQMLDTTLEQEFTTHVV